jgi:anthranilate synthase component 2
MLTPDMKRILLIDNYDSFTYNLAHLIEKIIHHKVDVVLNDRIDFEAIGQYQGIVLSPGPGIPEEAGLLLPLIQTFAPLKKMLGVCLGHQAIAQVFGCALKNLDKVYHGVQTDINIYDKSGLFKGLDNTERVGRYHSWVVDTDKLPDQLKVTATDSVGNVMAFKHSQYDVEGVQFHPESIMTPCGEKMMSNWLLG